MSTADVATSVKKAVETAVAELHLRAAIVAVRVGDKLILSQAWGESISGETATTEMKWRIGAIAIPYMTTVLLQLRDRGILSLDDPLSKWYPQYPAADTITLRMLANSTSGYADYVDTLPILQDVHRQWSDNELLAEAFSKPLVCAPGSCFAYSHTNFVILGQVMSNATGKPLASLIREGVLNPLDLRGTRSSPEADIPGPVLNAYSDSLGTYQDSTDWNPSWTLASGAIMTSTIDDVLRSAEAIGTGALLTASSHTEMLESSFPIISPTLDTRYFGLGIVLAKSWILETPMFFGYSGVMAYLPANRISIAVTSTNEPSSPDGFNSAKLFERVAAALAPSNVPSVAGSLRAR